MSVQSVKALKPNETKPWQFKCQARTECDRDLRCCRKITHGRLMAGVLCKFHVF